MKAFSGLDPKLKSKFQDETVNESTKLSIKSEPKIESKSEPKSESEKIETKSVDARRKSISFNDAITNPLEEEQSNHNFMKVESRKLVIKFEKVYFLGNKVCLF